MNTETKHQPIIISRTADSFAKAQAAFSSLPESVQALIESVEWNGLATTPIFTIDPFKIGGHDICLPNTVISIQNDGPGKTTIVCPSMIFRIDNPHYDCSKKNFQFVDVNPPEPGT